MHSQCIAGLENSRFLPSLRRRRWWRQAVWASTQGPPTWTSALHRACLHFSRNSVGPAVGDLSPTRKSAVHKCYRGCTRKQIPHSARDDKILFSYLLLWTAGPCHTGNDKRQFCVFTESSAQLGRATIPGRFGKRLRANPRGNSRWRTDGRPRRNLRQSAPH